MPRETTTRAVDKLVEAMNDNRFRPNTFGSMIADESPDVSYVFYQIVLAFIQAKSRQYDIGSSEIVASQCSRLAKDII